MVMVSLPRLRRMIGLLQRFLRSRFVRVGLEQSQPDCAG